MSSDHDPTQWTIHGERLVDENRHIRLSVASVTLPDGVEFDQYVIRMPRCAMTAVVDEQRILLIRRHRWIIDRWVWELPGGYVDHVEDGALAAAREVEEETGWRPTGPIDFVMTYQPIIGSGDCPQDLYVAHGAEQTGAAPDINEAADVAWFPVADVPAMVAAGEVVGAATIIAALHLLRSP
ncbi:MAG: NUDIX domain-containing protein [Streptosporangiales bacterium]|nr:NUDIX domain-containing protein [Streptosporangiales bacterium]